MAEIIRTPTEHQADAVRPPTAIAPMGWRRSSIGLGMFVMVCALFAVASGRPAVNVIGKLLLVVALLLIAAPIAVSVANAALGLTRWVKRTTAKPGA